MGRPIGRNESTHSIILRAYDSGITVADEEIIRRVEEMANKKGWKMSQVALAWLKSKDAVPVIGFNTVCRIDEACEVRGKGLVTQEIKWLEEPYVPKLVVGHM